MNRFITLLFILILISCQPKQATDLGSSTDELKKAIERFNIAFAESQTEVLDAMLTESYRHTNSSNKAANKQNWLSYISKRNDQITNGELQVLEYDMDELDIQMYGNSAHVTGRISTKIARNDTISENEYRVTHLWVLENGEWKRAGFHDGKIK